jgi:general secretion pathway protein M
MNIFEPIQTRFAELEPRERWMVVICTVFVVITVLWLYVWQPVQEQRAGSASRAQAELATLAAVRSGANTLNALQRNSGPKPNSAARNTSLGALVDNSIRRSTLVSGLDKVQPDGENVVKIWLKDVDFNALTIWLDLMKTRYQATAVNVGIERSDESSKVSARLTLER